MPKEKPMIHSVVLCDFVHRDGLGKCYLMGTFNKVHAKEFPAEHSPIAIYISLSHWVYDQTLEVRLVQDSVNVIASLPPLLIPKHDALQGVELGLNLPPVVIPSEGRYEFHVLVEREILHILPFSAVLRQAPTGGG